MLWATRNLNGCFKFYVIIYILLYSYNLIVMKVGSILVFIRNKDIIWSYWKLSKLLIWIKVRLLCYVKTTGHVFVQDLIIFILRKLSMANPRLKKPKQRNQNQNKNLSFAYNFFNLYYFLFIKSTNIIKTWYNLILNPSFFWVWHLWLPRIKYHHKKHS